MTPYEAAVNMFHREHARWNQWVLFYFGSIVSIFVISEKTILYIPKWFPSLLGFVVSIMFIAVATTLGNWGRPLDYWFTNNFMYDIQIICHAKPA